jgi:NAD(P)-dependent dehydrogenase (short-subunit alcohol dehydrogenase family)
MASQLRIERRSGMNRFEGKIILVSGGSRGQGTVEARQFIDIGARVVIGDVLMGKAAFSAIR